jgi:chromate transporter
VAAEAGEGGGVKGGDTLATLALQFSLLSLIAFGGANALIPEIRHQSVDIHRWMSDGDFTALYAIAQACPGPNFLVSTLVGWKAAGVPGALVATAGMCGPSCFLTFWVAKVWDRHQAAPWRVALGAGLAPVTVGFVFASAFLLIRSADRDWRLALVTAASAAIAYLTRLNPLWCLLAAAALGAVGLFGS